MEFDTDLEAKLDRPLQSMSPRQHSRRSTSSEPCVQSMPKLRRRSLSPLRRNDKPKSNRPKRHSPSPPRRDKSPGALYIARYDINHKSAPKTPGARNIVIMHGDKESRWSMLSQHALRDARGRYISALYEFSKVYKGVPHRRLRIGAETYWFQREAVHYAHGQVQPDYWEWRDRGMSLSHAVYRPNKDAQPLFHLWRKGKDNPAYTRLSIVDARKRILCREYLAAVKRTREFAELQRRVDHGDSLQLCDPEGPIPMSSTQPPYDQLDAQTPGLRVTEENVRMLLNDPSAPFCTTWILACALLRKEHWLD